MRIDDLIAGQHPELIDITYPAETNSVGSSSVRILKNDRARVWVCFINNGNGSLWLRPRGDAAVNRSFRVAGGGGLLTFDWREDLYLPAYDWFGIAEFAATDIDVVAQALIK